MDKVVESMELPLSFVIFNNTALIATDHSKLITYNSRLEIAHFKADRINPPNILAPINQDTDAFEWRGRKFA